MPYFHSLTLEALQQRKERHEELTKYRYCCAERDEAQPLAVHLPFSLDEYCNPSLNSSSGSSSSSSRNNDQVVFRYEERKLRDPEKRKTELRHTKDPNQKPPKAIIVGQAWLWELGTTLVTAMPLDGLYNTENEYESVGE